mmetsp:Transcript_83017/g.231753  ORF Transcript_83017/g.231753 Transcript_83017/m.231753 type:complete len:200 (-) Transcript_83017:363-962(-)
MMISARMGPRSTSCPTSAVTSFEPTRQACRIASSGRVTLPRMWTSAPPTVSEPTSTWIWGGPLLEFLTRTKNCPGSNEVHHLAIRGSNGTRTFTTRQGTSTTSSSMKAASDSPSPTSPPNTLGHSTSDLCARASSSSHAPSVSPDGAGVALDADAVSASSFPVLSSPLAMPSSLSSAASPSFCSSAPSSLPPEVGAPPW